MFPCLLQYISEYVCVHMLLAVSVSLPLSVVCLCLSVCLSVCRCDCQSVCSCVHWVCLYLSKFTFVLLFSHFHTDCFVYDLHSSVTVVGNVFHKVHHTFVKSHLAFFKRNLSLWRHLLTSSFFLVSVAYFGLQIIKYFSAMHKWNIGFRPRHSIRLLMFSIIMKAVLKATRLILPFIKLF